MVKIKRLKYYAGEWKDSVSQKYMPVSDSSTGEVIAEVPCCTRAEVEEAIETAHRAFPDWSGTPVSKRAQLMFRYREILDAHLEELAVLAAGFWPQAKKPLKAPPSMTSNSDSQE